MKYFILDLCGGLSPTVNIFYFLLFCCPLVDYINSIFLFSRTVVALLSCSQSMSSLEALK